MYHLIATHQLKVQFPQKKIVIYIELTAGNHQIEYKYTPSGFVCGIAVTAITAFGLCGYYIFSKSSLKLNKRARKKEKNIVE